MVNDFNEFITTNTTLSHHILVPEKAFEPELDNEPSYQPLEFNDIDLELIEPYSSFEVSMRKNAIKEKYTSISNVNGNMNKEEPNWNDVSLTTFDKTDPGSLTPNRGNKIYCNNNTNEQSFISDLNIKPLTKSEGINCTVHHEEKRGKAINSIYQAKENYKKNKQVKKRSKDYLNPKKPLKKCKCTKSKCLRLYCECFAKGMVCGVDCNCTDCHNTEDHRPLRELVIQETLEKNPYAFKSKYKRLDQQDNILHSRGCNCSKTGCVKEYCECFKAGTGCSRLCRCSNCLNKKIDIEPDEVKVYYDRVLRKRKNKSVLRECISNKMEIIRNMGLNFN